MKALVESWSLSSLAILIAVLPVGVVWLLSTVLPVALPSLWVVNSLYWLPVWLGADSSEYSAWALRKRGAT